MRERYQVYGVEVHVTDDVPLIVRTFRLAVLAVIAGVVFGYVFH